MTSQYEIDCALMAGRAYQTSRNQVNWFANPDGWTEFFHVPNETYPTTTGFEAVSFVRNGNPNEIVISYAGTDFKDVLGDWAADGALGAGLMSGQLLQAAEYYLNVKAANPSAKITLTGHSLGGGLAALIAVFFNETAVTFDQAPFRNSASWMLATQLRMEMSLKFPTSTYPQIATLLDPLDRFILSFDPLGLGWSLDGLAAREAKVTNISVQGEVLDGSLSNYFRIGRTVQTLEHGDTTLSGTDLHSIALLSAFKLNDGFRSVTYKLTDLLAMVFDTSLFAYTTDKSNTTNTNLLEHLLRHQAGGIDGIPVGGNQMLDRFAADLGTLAATPGFAASGNLTDALIAFAMQGYYSGPHAAEAGQQMLEAVSGGIHLDRGDIAASLGEVRGYSRYFQNFLVTLPETEKMLIDQKLAGLLDWYLAGTQLVATAGTQTAFMLGAGNTDNLTGGTQADLLVGLGGVDFLVGGGGADTLVGGEGADYLMGGEGNDDYIVTNGDTIIDRTDDGFGGDGQGQIKWGTLNPAGSYDRKQNSVTEWGDTDWTFEFVGERETGGLLTIVKGGERVSVAGRMRGAITGRRESQSWRDGTMHHSACCRWAANDTWRRAA